ncbi:uncharacterized protein LOC143013974 [Genypterus blacodes]|uniref:uncharacterized protein LOC143013974 n=1 Tax=Genypterus blacodes TaxID=154954 RepID=UPI003F75EFFC
MKKQYCVDDDDEDVGVVAVHPRFRDVSPVRLQIVGGAVNSRLYCGAVEGLAASAAGLVEAFLVEFYRCKFCHFTCGLKSIICSHLQNSHHHLPLSCLGEASEGGGADELDGASKQSEDDEENMNFLLPMYGMLGNMSPPPCDISTDGGLPVAHTCEVSTLFEGEEEESSIFPLRGGSVELSIHPPATQEEMAQSAHLMTLGLCRIANARPPPPLPPPPAPPTRFDQPCPQPDSCPQQPPPLDNLMESVVDQGPRARAEPLHRQSLQCLLCPLTLSSKCLLDIHERSHQANPNTGGFSCPCCRQEENSWEGLELHWTNHYRKKKRRRRGEETRKKEENNKKQKRTVCQRAFHNAAQEVEDAAHLTVRGRHHTRNTQSDGCRGLQKQTGLPDSQTIPAQGPGGVATLTTPSPRWKKTGRAEDKQKNKATHSSTKETKDFCCSLCHRTFSSKLTLRRHLGVHSGDKTFSCPHCAYSSRLKASLLQHLRTHTGEKPYRCAQCSYASIDRSSLLRHSRTHTQEKPYSCQHCSYSSIQKKSLDLHARRHHTGEVFQCPLCHYSSPDRQLLLRHTRKHHSSSQYAAGCQKRAAAV